MTTNAPPQSSPWSCAPIIIGCWQFSSGHSGVPSEEAVDVLEAITERGFCTFDCADIYSGVEEILGRLRMRLGHRASNMRVHTKLVPDLDALPRIDRTYVRNIVERSCRRLRTDRLNLIQFHWWRFDMPGWIDALGYVVDLQREGLIEAIGVTNFDTERLKELLDAGIPIVSNQVQYSVLDQRPSRKLAALCTQRGIKLLTYGTCAGGFISDRYIGATEGDVPMDNRSLIKYRLIIDELGGWSRFQDVLKLLCRIGKETGLSVSQVAMRYVLQQAGVGAIIVGARSKAHLPELESISQQGLSVEHMKAIAEWSATAQVPGEVYELERELTGKHAAIMRYNLNAESKN
jgi:aryl-alcohol dehydrogenase-like predicted oxidoreductase